MTKTNNLTGWASSFNRNFNEPSHKISAPFPLGGGLMLSSMAAEENQNRKLSWLEKLGTFVIVVGLVTTSLAIAVNGFRVFGLDENTSTLTIFSGIGVTVFGLVIWSTGNVLTKGYRNAEN